MSALSHSVSLCQVVSCVVRVCWAVLRRLAVLRWRSACAAPETIVCTGLPLHSHHDARVVQDAYLLDGVVTH